MTIAQRCRGFTLIEVALALGIVVFCLVAVFGLLPIGMNSNRDAIRQTAANNIAKAIVTDLRSTPSAANNPSLTGSSPIFGFEIPPAGQPGGALQTVYFAEAGNATGQLDSRASSTSLYRATLFFTPPAAGTRTATTARLLVTWPAMADPLPAATPSNYSESYETVVSLDRN